MSRAAKGPSETNSEPGRVLGRGLRAARGVHLTLKTVRDAAGKTQVDIAQTSGIDQADISRLERREALTDCQVSTLERYIAALGGRLELVAVFGNKKIVLAGAQPASQGDGRA